MLCRILLWNHLVQGFCVLGVFWWLLQFCELLLVCSGFLLLLHLVFKDYIFLEMCPFHPGFQVSWHIVLHSYFLHPLLFCSISCNFYFISNDLFGSSLFFSWWVWLNVCQFCLSFQRISSWIHWFFELFILFYFIFLVSMSFNSALILIISFLLLTCLLYTSDAADEHRDV